ncbi:RnfABCDGE type electron transport complex subunit B [Nevskia soli]|uniref:RnfABCDGE type electron transport complex subunit B n=1 Tax=Nevskia soli TaxID=418856 RepID=UPI00056D91A2|nr:RnfABCDGE type electron transport complex subunit B [Nevskia soli]
MIDALPDRIDALLPQTQCTRCGYDGCKPYAEAVAAGAANINQCPPGGAATISALARLLGVPPKPLNPENGLETEIAAIAVIDETRCIGCFKCVLACPVDAIVGAAKLMHTVIAAECSGCELCIPPCPVDCIVMAPRPMELPAPEAMAAPWRQRHAARKARLGREQQARAAARRRAAPSLRDKAGAIDIAAAIARSRARRNSPNQS